MFLTCTWQCIRIEGLSAISFDWSRACEVLTDKGIYLHITQTSKKNSENCNLKFGGGCLTVHDSMREA